MSENIGFLTVIDHVAPGSTDNGLAGGLLVLNRAGRPLEFHCTMPFVPDRIQEILYGNTLHPFLYGERIAQTLIQRTKLPLLSVFTNLAEVLPVQPLVSVPIVYVFDEFAKPELPDADVSGQNLPIREISEELHESLKHFGIDNTNLRTRTHEINETRRLPEISGFDTENWREFRLGNRLIAVPEVGFLGRSRHELIADITEAARTIDLLEPFTRIVRALAEAGNAA